MSDQKSEIHLFFPTPVWTSKIKDHASINLKMSEYIYKLKNNDPRGVKKTNIKGWHSQDFNLQDDIPRGFINTISYSINNMIQDMDWDTKNQKIKITNMWSIINFNDSSNARHIHGNNFISAAYYVKAPKNSGNIVFYDPRSAPAFSSPMASKPNKLNANTHSLEPHEGLLVFFPSYLHHSVDSNNSNEERIVISFNIDFNRN